MQGTSRSTKQSREVCLVGFPKDVQVDDPRFDVRRIDPGIAHIVAGRQSSIYNGVLTVFYPNPELFAWPSHPRYKKMLVSGLYGILKMAGMSMPTPEVVLKRIKLPVVPAGEVAAVEAEAEALAVLRAGPSPDKSGAHYTIVIVPPGESCSPYSQGLWVKWLGGIRRVPRRLPIRSAASVEHPPIAALLEYMRTETTPKQVQTIAPTDASSVIGGMNLDVVCTNSRGEPLVYGASRGAHHLFAIPAVEDVPAYLRLVIDRMAGSAIEPQAAVADSAPADNLERPEKPVSTSSPQPKLSPRAEPIVKSLAVRDKPVLISGQRLPGYVVDVKYTKIGADDRQESGGTLAVRFGHKTLLILMSFFVAGKQPDEESRVIKLRRPTIGNQSLRHIFPKEDTGFLFKYVQYVTNAFDKATKRAGLADWKIRPIEAVRSGSATWRFRLKPEYQHLFDMTAFMKRLRRNPDPTQSVQAFLDLWSLLPGKQLRPMRQRSRQFGV